MCLYRQLWTGVVLRLMLLTAVRRRCGAYPRPGFWGVHCAQPRTQARETGRETLVHHVVHELHTLQAGESAPVPYQRCLEGCNLADLSQHLQKLTPDPATGSRWQLEHTAPDSSPGKLRTALLPVPCVQGCASSCESTEPLVKPQMLSDVRTPSACSRSGRLCMCPEVLGGAFMEQHCSITVAPTFQPHPTCMLSHH